MTEEPIGEISEIQESTKRPRKALFGIFLVIIIGVASIFGYVWVANQGVPASKSTEYVTYSQYNFSFRHPKGMSLVEYGLLESNATYSSGTIVGALKNDEHEVVQVGWETTIPKVNLEGRLTKYFNSYGIKDFETDIVRGKLVASTKAEHELIYQHFTVEAEGEFFYGIVGVWHCDKNDRSYHLGVLYTEQDMFLKFERYLDSFVCHSNDKNFSS